MSRHPWNLDLWRGLTRERARLPHAMLLQGPIGTGKRQFAADLAKWLLCEHPGPAGACGHCRSCGWFEQGAHPDFRLVEPGAESDADNAEGKKGGKHITINEIRGLSDFFGLVSHQGGWRVVVIQPAELLNAAAANALLKTLEEPPERVLIVLVAHQPRRLLATVRSRCRKVVMALPDSRQARAWLADQGMQAHMDVLDEVGGAPLLALEYAEPERLERRRRFLDALANPTPLGLSQLSQEFQHRLDEAWGWLSRWLYDLTVAGARGRPRYFPGREAALLRLAGQVDTALLWHCLQDVIGAGRWLRHPLNGQLLLESWLLRYLDSVETSHGR